MTTDNKDPRLADESKLQEIRRRVEEVAADAPHLAKIALEAMIRKHTPDLKGGARSAGRAGKQSGNVSGTQFAGMVKRLPGYRRSSIVLYNNQRRQIGQVVRHCWQNS